MCVCACVCREWLLKNYAGQCDPILYIVWGELVCDVVSSEGGGSRKRKQLVMTVDRDTVLWKDGLWHLEV